MNPTDPPASPAFTTRTHLWVLIALTAGAAALHFTRLWHPALWYDESATFGRVNGSFGDLVNLLRRDGFLPLHYEIYWLLGRFVYLSPSVMRIVPALAGTAMVPACYFFGRQLISPRHGLALAAFAACSAYMSYYSRDAKMYMELWLPLTLHMGALAWWVRTRKRVAWLSWLAAGVTAACVHPSALLIVALEPLFFLLLAKPRRSWGRLAFGLIVIVSGPAYFYLSFNQWIDRSGGLAPVFASGIDGQEPDWKNSGLIWLDIYNKGKTGSDLALDTTSAFLLGCEWPFSRDTPLQQTVPDWWVLSGLLIAGTILAGAMAAGLVTTGSGPRTPPNPFNWSSAPLVIAVWIVLPIYGVFYCRSFHYAVGPWDWLAEIWRAIGVVGWAEAAIGAWLVAWLLPRFPRLAPPLRWVAAGLAGMAGAAGFLLWRASNGHWAADPFFARQMAVAALAVAIPLAWRHSGSSRGERIAQVIRLAGAALVVLGLCAAAFVVWRAVEYGAERYHPDFKWMSIWFPRYTGVVWPAMALAAVALILRLPGRWLRGLVLAMLLGVNLAGAIGRIVVDSEPPLDRVAQDIVRTHYDPATRVVITGRHTNWMSQPSGGYYIAYFARLRLSPTDFRGGLLLKRFKIMSSPSREDIDELLESHPLVTRFIVWDRLGQNVAFNPRDDVFRTLLPAGWRVVDESRIQSRQSRGWRDGDWFYRRVLEKVPSATR